MGLGKRDRSLNGCGTCRLRHVKCDAGRPFCQMCSSSNLHCAGYEIRLQFVHHGEPEPLGIEDATRFRRPLFTGKFDPFTWRKFFTNSGQIESEREKMSLQLSQKIGRKDPGKALLQLEESISMGSVETSLCSGPFGAFQLSVDSPETVSSSQADDIAASTDITSGADQMELEVDAERDLDDQLAILDLPVGVDDINIDLPWDSEALANPLLLPSPSPPTSGYADTWELLSYYRERVIPLMSPLNVGSKSPWHHLIHPAAMNAMGELSMGSVVTGARSALLHAILATSILHRGPAAGLFWELTAEDHQRQAQKDLLCCFQKEIGCASKKVKYKEVLMAIISLATLAVFRCDSKSLLAYLLLAEKYIRMYGLTKPYLSRKVRLLHHCYTYLRIINETIHISDNVPDKCQELDPILDGPAPSRRDEFRITQWSVVPDFELKTLKDIYQGHNDLHLEIPGRWDFTMYPEIFGIPESFLILVSHITRLGNERDQLLKGDSSTEDDTRKTHKPTMRDFLVRAKLLDQHVCRWEPPEGPHYFMFCAMHKALIIFFYRRVYDVNVATLQNVVQQVRDLLAQSHARYAEAGQRTIYTMWPAFIAACEALSPDLQEYFQSWFTQGFEQSGLRSFTLARSIAETVWTSRREGQETVHWPDIMSSRRAVLVCV